MRASWTCSTPQPGERVLDLGCGTGHLTNDIATAVGEDGAVVGIDQSPAMVAKAREQYPDLDFEQADATEYTNEQGFDAVFSNAALHWITDQERVVERVAELVVDTAASLFDVPGVAVYVIDNASNQLAPLAYTDAFEALSEGSPAVGDDALLWNCFATGKRLVFNDAEDARESRVFGDRVESGLVVPMGDYGVFVVATDGPGIDDTRRLAETLVATTEAAFLSLTRGDLVDEVVQQVVNERPQQFVLRVVVVVDERLALVELVSDGLHGEGGVTVLTQRLKRR